MHHGGEETGASAEQKRKITTGAERVGGAWPRISPPSCGSELRSP